MLASMQEGGAPSMEGPRKTLSPAQRQKRKSKRKQASKARKNNRKRK